MGRKRTKLECCWKCKALISEVSRQFGTCTNVIVKKPSGEDRICFADLPWDELLETTTDALSLPPDHPMRRHVISQSGTTGQFIFASMGGEETEYSAHPITERNTSPQPLATLPTTDWAEKVAGAERLARQRPWELSIRGGFCRLIRARLLGGIALELARQAGVWPVVWEYVSPVVSVHRKRSLQRYLPPGVPLEDVPEDRAKAGRRHGKLVKDPRLPGLRESHVCEWKRDRQRYYELRIAAFKLKGQPGAQEAAEAALEAHMDLAARYRNARQCGACADLIPSASKALYCTPACKQQAKARRSRQREP